jgi:hypothetical protein
MKNIRVYTLIKVVAVIFGLAISLQLILHNFFHIDYEPLIILTVSSVIFLLSSFFGLSREIDLYKNTKGYIIDEREKINWKLNNSIFLICAIIQLFSAFFPKFLSDGIGGDFNYFQIALLPTFVFIIRSSLKRISNSESLGLLLIRRERVRTEDLEELVKKVDLEKWIINDPVLQKDKELFSKLIPIDHFLLEHFDDSLKHNADFILGLPNINFYFLSGLSLFPLYIDIHESDLTNEVVIKILENSDDSFWADSDFSKLFVKKIIDMYENLKDENNLTPMPVVKAFYSIRYDVRNARLLSKSFKECLNHKHIIEKELEHCPYCK